MYFYTLEGGSFEEYYKTVYMSKTKYTKQEFLDIITEAYKYVCEEILPTKECYGLCFNDFEVENILWDCDLRKGSVENNDFNTYIKTYYNLIPVETDENATVFVGTCTTPNEITKIIKKSVDKNTMPSCKGSCPLRTALSYIDDEVWFMKRCFYPDIRKQAYEKNKKNWANSEFADWCYNEGNDISTRKD